MNTDAKTLNGAFERIIGKITENHRKPRDYGIGEVLYPSEIQTILLIGQNPGISVTELADKNGVTKGAVSQLLNRLDAKELIIRNEDPRNLSRINLDLTPRGKKAFKSYRNRHRKNDLVILKFLESLNEKERETIGGFFKAVEKGLGGAK